MPGTAVIDTTTALGAAAECVDDARECLTEVGSRPYRVSTVLRTWSGLRRGENDFVDAETELTPRPLFEVAGLRLDLPQAGLVERGGARLRELSLTYTEAEIAGPAVLAPNEEWFIKVVDGGGQGIRTRYYVLEEPPFADWEKAFGWIVKLHRADNTDGEAAP